MQRVARGTIMSPSLISSLWVLPRELAKKQLYVMVMFLMIGQ